MKLRTIGYEGFHGYNGQIVYVVDGNDVYFTGIGAAVHATTTINAAEAVIEGICRDLGRPWHDLTFYDVQTRYGYQGRPEGWYLIDRLEVEARETGLYVDEWIPVAHCLLPRRFDLLMPFTEHDRKNLAKLQEEAKYEAEQRPLPGVPAHIIALFKSFID